MTLPAQIFGAGVYGEEILQIDPTSRAARVSLRGPEVLGSYSIALVSGVMAAGLAAGSPIFNLRWTDPTALCLIRRVRLTAVTDVTAFAQGAAIFDLVRALEFMSTDTGGANIILAGKAQARASRYIASRMQQNNIATGNLAIANTGTLTPVSRDLDNNAMGVLLGSVGAVPSTVIIPQPGILYDGTDPRKNELEISLQEGFVIRATVPATGTWRFGVEMDWDEVTSATYF